jgi:hypothetical protein
MSPLILRMTGTSGTASGTFSEWNNAGGPYRTPTQIVPSEVFGPNSLKSLDATGTNSGTNSGTFWFRLLSRLSRKSPVVGGGTTGTIGTFVPFVPFVPGSKFAWLNAAARRPRRARRGR